MNRSDATEPIEALNEQWSDAPITMLLQTIAEEFAGRVVFANSFGLEDVVVQHIVQGLEPAIESFVLDTGRLPPETYDLIDRWRVRYNVSIRLISPRPDLLEPFVTLHGPNSFYQSLSHRKSCCGIRKIEPLTRALEGKTAWITGLRREQSAARSQLEIFEWDEAGRLKINPLAAWSLDEVWSYVNDHQLPYNVLHDRGYPSVGCAPCTRAIEAGEDLRAGRWWWELDQQRECGLHRGPTGSRENKEDRYEPVEHSAP